MSHSRQQLTCPSCTKKVYAKKFLHVSVKQLTKNCPDLERGHSFFKGGIHITPIPFTEVFDEQ